MKEIKSTIALLPPRQKMTVLLHGLLGHSKSKISSIMECPEATVRSNLHIARNKFKKILKGWL